MHNAETTSLPPCGSGRTFVGPARSKSSQESSAGQDAVLQADKFETEAGSIEEDEVRRQALRDYTPIIGPVGWVNIGLALRQAKAFVLGRRLPRLYRRRALALIRKLDPDADGMPPTLASAVAMLQIRVKVIDALIAARADILNKELCTVTLVKSAWVCTPDQLAAVETLEVQS